MMTMIIMVMTMIIMVMTLIRMTMASAVCLPSVHGGTGSQQVLAV